MLAARGRSPRPASVWTRARPGSQVVEDGAASALVLLVAEQTLGAQGVELAQPLGHRAPSPGPGTGGEVWPRRFEAR